MDTRPQDVTYRNRSFITRLRTGVRFLHARHFKPKSTAEDGYRRELMLNIILLGSICLLTLLDASLLYNIGVKGDSFSGAAFWKFSLLVALFASLYFLSRRGHLKTASYALIFLYFLGVSISASCWGVSLPANLLGFALIITISGVLISSRFGIFMAGTTFITLIVIGWKEIASDNLPTWKAEMVTLSDVIVYAILLFLITIISWLSNREKDYSLKRARRSEAELMLEKGSLETKVRERTEDLQKAQVERVAQLSRFAEFGRLSSGLFHDLVSPLSAIAINLHGVENSNHPDIREIQDQIDRALRASRRMDIFISSIKKQIRIDEFCDTFSPNDIIEEAVTIFHYKAAKLNVMISFVAEQKLSLFGNPIKFHQILSNLISNAVDSYHPVGLGQNRESREIEVVLKKQENLIIVTVEDHGSGIAPEILSKIFDQFFTTKSRDVGMGLGLSTTKEIVEKDFSGTIQVSSVPNKGTKFTVTIPNNTGHAN